MRLSLRRPVSCFGTLIIVPRHLRSQVILSPCITRCNSSGVSCWMLGCSLSGANSFPHKLPKILKPSLIFQNFMYTFRYCPSNFFFKKSPLVFQNSMHILHVAVQGKFSGFATVPHLQFDQVFSTWGFSLHLELGQHVHILRSFLVCELCGWCLEWNWHTSYALEIQWSHRPINIF